MRNQPVTKTILSIAGIAVLFLYGCDALVSSGDRTNNSDLPEGEKNLEVLTETHWVSLPDQLKEGEKPDDATSWYTFKLVERLDDNEFRFRGRHFFVMDEHQEYVGLGNRNGVTYHIDSDGNKTITQGPWTTFMDVPIYENASFLYIKDWIISNENGFLTVKYSPPSTEKHYLFKFEPLTEEHVLYEQIIDYSE
ncbi:MAG: hypothetical protein JJU46_00115 [Balneolaceae bacterium]|nr:hypothetical protein [Balneolaceae bacterium]MCH8549430.1 hypothetical protein [Balneolaceae bacterium]